MSKLNKNTTGITLITLVITIVVLIILSSVVIYFALGNNGILNKAKEAKNETLKQAATEKMNLKITNIQIETYGEEQRMPTLQEFSDGLCEDDEIQYVELQSKKVGSLEKINVGNASSIFTKLKEYPYEFEINSSLQLASIDGIKVATTPSTDGNEGPNSQNTMSGTEHFTGEYYFNGKPIYAKTIYIESLPNKTTKSYNHNISNVEEIWMDQSNSYMKKEDSRLPLPWLNNSNIANCVQIIMNSTSINIRTYTDFSPYFAYVTIKYTKTTDTGNGGTITATPANE